MHEMEDVSRTERRAPRISLPRPLPFHPLLLAAYSVLFLWSQNLDEATLGDVTPPLVQVVIAALVLVGVLTLVLRDARRAAVVASAILASFLGFGHVDRLLAPLRLGQAAQFGGWLVLIVIAAAFALRARRSLAPATSALNVVAFALVAVALVTIAPHELSRIGRDEPNTGALPPAAASASGVGTQRDIYYLVLDRYGSESSLRLDHGFDDDLPEWLAARGFFVAQQSHANYARTALSLAATLNLRYLDELTSRYGRKTEDVTPAYRMIRNNAVVPFIKSRGYRYIHIGSWFEGTRTSPLADVNFNVGDESEFSSVFAETTALPAISDMLGREKRSHRERHRAAALYQLEKLSEARAVPGPKFVFAHVLLPHQPYVFRSDGGVVTAEEARRMPESRLYEEQLQFTKDRIREILEPLLNVPEPSRPIVVLQSDEGPYVRAGFPGSAAERLRIRYGILNAFYLPGEASRPGSPGTTPYPTISAVNTFRMLFSRYFAADLPLLPDRSYRWVKGGLYDFRDVTDVLMEGASGGSTPATRARTGGAPLAVIPEHVVGIDDPTPRSAGSRPTRRLSTT